MTVSKRVRFEVFKRDEFVCRYCGLRPPETVLHVDHVVPRAAGGSDDPENLVTSCMSCNLGKSDKSLGSVLPQVSELERLAALQELAERKTLLQKQVIVANAQREAEANAIATVAEWVADDLGVEYRPAYRATLISFIRRLGIEGIREAVSVAAIACDSRNISTQDRAWRYFCGVCWNWIRKSEGGADGTEA